MSTWSSVGGLDPSLDNFGMSRGIIVCDLKSKVKTLTINQTLLITTKGDESTRYKNMDDLRRARELGVQMNHFFAMTDTIYVELPTGSQSARAMASYGICVGLVAALGKRVVRVSAKDVKMIATNNPKASKKDMIKWANNKYPKLPWLTRKLHGELVLTNANEHIADSIAAIHAGLNMK